MIDLLWPFRRKTSIILPHTTNFFLIYNGNGRVDPGVNDFHEQVFYSYPTIDLAPEVKQVLEICGAPYSLKFQKIRLIDRNFMFDIVVALTGILW